MISFKKLLFKMCDKQWIIGIAPCNIEDVIRKQKIPHTFHWIKPADAELSFADPFIIDLPEGKTQLLFEEYTTGHYDGIIKVRTLNSLRQTISEQTLLKDKTHLSYPFLYVENDQTYLFPEMGRSGAMYGYEFNPETALLNKKKIVIDVPLIDASILHYQGRYWIFATPFGDYSQQHVHIYHSENLFGPYQPHKQNPVKAAINGARPAGNFIKVDGEIYRPSQNCKNYYGESITIQKITVLNLDEYREEVYCTLPPPRAGKITLGIHTINSSGQYLAIDALVGRFNPLGKIRKRLRRKWFSANK